MPRKEAVASITKTKQTDDDCVVAAKRTSRRSEIAVRICRCLHNVPLALFNLLYLIFYALRGASKSSSDSIHIIMRGTMTVTRSTMWEQLMVAITAGALSVVCLIAVHSLHSRRLESRVASDSITFRMSPERAADQQRTNSVPNKFVSVPTEVQQDGAVAAVPADVQLTPQSVTAQPEDREPLDSATLLSAASPNAASGGSSSVLSWWSNFSAVRIMFVGDSISEGLASGSSARFVPKNGSCSFRFHLIHRVRHSTALKIKPVGPFSASFGGVTPSSCCAAAIRAEKTAADSARLSSVAGQNCMRDFAAHASIWGVRLEALINSTNAQLLQHRLGLYRKYFRKQTSSRLGVTPEGPLALKQVGTPLQRWASAYKPHIVLLFAGTNDYSYGVAAATIVSELMPVAISQMMRRSASTIRRIAVCTLLPRRAFDVSELNDNLLAIRTCRQTGARSANPSACISCVESLLSNAEADVWRVWCDARVRILHCGNPQRITNTTEFLYDGLHPNWHGEEVLANIIHSEMQAEGVL